MKESITKLLIAALAAATLLTAAGCSNQNNGGEQSSQQTSTASAQLPSTPESTTPESAAPQSSVPDSEGSAAQQETSDTSDQVISTPTESSAAVSTPSGSDNEIKAQAAGDWTFSQYGTIINMTLGTDGSAVLLTNAETGSTVGTWEVKDSQVVVHANNVDEIFELKDGKLYGTEEKASIYFTRGTTEFTDVSEPVSEFSDVEESGDDDDNSLEFGGHVDSQYVGDWKFYIDTSEYESYGLDLANIQEYLDELEKSNISLKADGSATATLAEESATGVWESQGNIVNIILEGSKQKFTYRDGYLESDGLQLVKR